MNFYPVLFKDLIKLKRLCLKPFFISSMFISPFLYILTFGWGLSGKIHIKNISYMEFLIPAIVAISSMNNSFNWTAISIEIERTTFKTFEEYLLSPISATDIMVGKIISGCLKGVFSGMLILAIAWVFGVEIQINLFFVISLLLNCIIFASAGVICGIKAKVHGDTAAFSNFFLLPMSLFCGTFFPLDNLPKTIATLIYLLPFTHSVICLRSALLKGSVPFISLIYLSCFCLIFFIIGIIHISRLK